MTRIVLPTAYLAPVEYYAWILACGNALIEVCDHYTKQSYRNRCTIATQAGRQHLTIPVTGTGGEKCPVRDIRISGHGNWRHLHWTALESAYNHTPFFEYYRDDFLPFYREDMCVSLADFNLGLLRLTCGLLGIEASITPTDTYVADYGRDTLDMREKIHPKRDWRALDPAFQPREYYQVFSARHGFLPNMSIADLLFNMGPEALLVLRDSIRLI